MINCLRRRILDRNDRGAIAVMVALMASMLCVCGALAVDLGNISQLHNQAQTAVDDAALSAAYYVAGSPTSSNEPAAVTAAEQEMISTLGYTPSSWNTCGSPPSSNFTTTVTTENCILFYGNDAWVGLPPQTSASMFGKAAKVASTTITASSTASYTAGVSGTQPCAICLMGTTGTDLYDTATIALTDSGSSAGIFVNSSSNSSSSNPALVVNNGGSLTTASSCSASSPPITAVASPVGTFSGVCPTPTGGATQLLYPSQIPLQSVLPQPSTKWTNGGAIPSASCTVSGGSVTETSGACGSASVSNSGSMTLPPGNYSSISLGSGTLTLQAGTYFISGQLNLSNGGTFKETSDSQGNGVTLVFTCGSTSALAACSSAGQAGGYISMGGGVSATLQAPTSPATSATYPYMNTAIYYDQYDTSAISLNNAASATTLTGTIWAPDAQITLAGSASVNAMIVAKSVNVSNGAKLSAAYNPTQNASTPSTANTVGLCAYGTNC